MRSVRVQDLTVLKTIYTANGNSDPPGTPVYTASIDMMRKKINRVIGAKKRARWDMLASQNLFVLHNS